jgi:hypothetical protein
LKQSLRVEKLYHRLIGIPTQRCRSPCEFDTGRFGELNSLPFCDHLENVRGALRDRPCGLREYVSGDIDVPNGNVREIRIRDRQTVPANQPVQSSVNAVGAASVVSILEDHLRPGAAHVKRARIQIGATGEPDLVHLKANPFWHTDPLFAGLHGLPAFILQQCDDLGSGNKRVSGGNAGPGMFGKDGRCAPPKIFGQEGLVGGDG